MEKVILENLLASPKISDLICLVGIYFLYRKTCSISDIVNGLENTVSYIRGKCENQNCHKPIEK